MLAFMNLLLVPIISMRIYYRRNKIKADYLIVLFDYVICVVSNSICSFVIMIITKQLFGIGAEPNSQTYTLVAALVAFFIPYTYEICKKYIDIRCEIITRKN